MTKRASQKNCGVLFLLLNATNLPKFRKRIVELVCVLVAEIRINPLRFRFRDNRFERNTRIAQFLFVQPYEAVLRFTEFKTKRVTNKSMLITLFVFCQIPRNSRYRRNVSLSFVTHSFVMYGNTFSRIACSHTSSTERLVSSSSLR